LHARGAIALGVGVVLIGIVPAAAYRSKSAARNAELPTEAAVPIDVATVVRKDVPIVVQALGTVQPIETVNVQSGLARSTICGYIPDR
jgi:multidrug efflux pump subunit AcrA (membrane-fusion protein)